MRVDERTRRYVARRTAEGKSKKEIMRCLKRYIAREVYRVLVRAASPSPIRSMKRATSPT
jgi:transposase